MLSVLYNQLPVRWLACSLPLLLLVAFPGRGQVAPDIAAPVSETPAAGYPQKTVTYYRDDDSVQPTREGAHHWVESTYLNPVSGRKRYFDGAGRLVTVTPYVNLKTGVIHGPQTMFYPEGQLRSRRDFVAGLMQGEFVVYYRSGKVKRRETYVDNVRTSGECLAEDGSSLPFFDYESLPTYQGGGTDKMVRAVMSYVHYPPQALQNHVQGVVFVSFQVSTDGEVEGVKAVKGVPSLDQAAVAAVKRLHGLVPGRIDGEPAAMSFTLPIRFALPASQPARFATN